MKMASIYTRNTAFFCAFTLLFLFAANAAAGTYNKWTQTDSAAVHSAASYTSVTDATSRSGGYWVADGNFSYTSVGAYDTVTPFTLENAVLTNLNAGKDHYEKVKNVTLKSGSTWNAATLNHSYGGTVTVESDAVLSTYRVIMGVGTLNIYGTLRTTTGSNYLGDAQSSTQKSVINIDGGLLSFASIGCSAQHGIAEYNVINGGQLVSRDSFTLGGQNSNARTGSYGKITLGSGNDPASAGSFQVKNNITLGNINEGHLILNQGSVIAPATLTVSGTGLFKLDSGSVSSAASKVLSESYGTASLTAYSGTISATNFKVGGSYGKTWEAGVANTYAVAGDVILAGDSQTNITGTVTLNAAGTLNFLATDAGVGKLTAAAMDAKKTGTYTVKGTGTGFYDNSGTLIPEVKETLSSKINAGISHGYAALTSDSYVIYSGPTANFLMDEKSVWDVNTDADAKTVTLTLADSAKKGDYILGDAAKTGLDSVSGWMKLSGFSTDRYELTFTTSAMSAAESAQFTEWLNADPDVSGVTALSETEYLVQGLRNLDFSNTFFAWDFTSAPVAGVMLTGFSGSSVPEPASWCLLFLGGCMVICGKLHKKINI